MTEHTPGPWTYRHRFPQDEHTVVHYAEYANGDEFVARNLITSTDARLIAAAPDLLEACKAAYASYNPNAGWAFGYVVGNKLADAIDKATD